MADSERVEGAERMKCPKYGSLIEYYMDFHSLSKSGKTMWFYYKCRNSKCNVLFKKGKQVHHYTELKELSK